MFWKTTAVRQKAVLGVARREHSLNSTEIEKIFSSVARNSQFIFAGSWTFHEQDERIIYDVNECQMEDGNSLVKYSFCDRKKINVAPG